MRPDRVETEFRELLYPWHPWFGLRVGVHAAIERSSDTVFRCSLSGSDADRWLEVPAWMFDRSACAKVQVADAHVDLAALTHLRSEEHTSELQSQSNLVCRLLLEKKKKKK